MASFHRLVMPCTKALRYAVGQLRRSDAACIAPQHGGVLARRADIQLALDRMESLEGIGIDGIC
jgi:flavorubredoxin